MPVAANPSAATQSRLKFSWFRLIVHDISRSSQTFAGRIEAFDHEKHLLAPGAFRKTTSEAGRKIPLFDQDNLVIGQLTVMRGRRDVECTLTVQGKLFSCIDREFLKALSLAG